MLSTKFYYSLGSKMTHIFMEVFLEDMTIFLW